MNVAKYCLLCFLTGMLFMSMNLFADDIQLDLSAISNAASITNIQNNKANILDPNGKIVGYIIYSDDNACKEIKGEIGPTPLLIVFDSGDYVRGCYLRECKEPAAALEVIKKENFLLNWNGYPIQGALTKKAAPLANAKKTSQAIVATFQKTLQSLLQKTSIVYGNNSGTVSTSNISNNNATVSTAGTNIKLSYSPTSANAQWSLCNASELCVQLATNTTAITVPIQNTNSKTIFSGSAKSNQSIQDIITWSDKLGCGNIVKKTIEEIDPQVWSERIKNEQRETRKVMIIITFLVGIALACIATYLLAIWCPFAKILLEPVKLIKDQIISIFKMPGGKTLFVVLALSISAGSLTALSIDTVRDWLFDKLAVFAMYYMLGFFWGFFIIVFLFLILLVLGCFFEVFKIFDGAFVFFIKWVWVLLIPFIFIICLGFSMSFAWEFFLSNTQRSQYIEACIKSSQSKNGDLFSTLPDLTKKKLYGFAVLSEYIYQSTGNNNLPNNVIPLAALPISGQYNSKTGIANCATSGLDFQILGNIASNEIIVVFKGTELTSSSDWYNDYMQYFCGKETAQFTQATAIVSFLLREYPNSKIILTGHSLGGGLAQYATAYHANPRLFAICFNAAGLSDPSLERIGDHNLADSQQRIIQVRSDGDLISEYGWHIGTFYNVNLGQWSTAVSNSSILRLLFKKYAQHSISVMSQTMKNQL